MEPPEQDSVEQNPLAGTEVDQSILIDDGSYLNELRAQIKEKSPQTDSEKIALAEELVKKKLKDALFAYQNKASLTPEQQAALDKLVNRDHPVPMSEVVNGGYGACIDFHTLEILLLEEMGVAAMQVGKKSKNHTFLYILKDGEYQLSDLFASVYNQNRGNPNHHFSSDYYTGDDVKLLIKTTHLKK